MVQPHRTLARQSLTRLDKLPDILEAVLEAQEHSADLLLERIANSSYCIKDVFATLAARLHRGCSPSGCQNLAVFMVGLCKMYGEAVQSTIIRLIGNFPDLFIPCSTALLSNRRVLGAALYEWSSMGYTFNSTNLSTESFLRHIFDLAIHMQLGHDFWAHFFRNIAVDKALAHHLYFMAIVAAENMDAQFTEDVAVAIVEFIMNLKSVEPSFDCSRLIGILAQAEAMGYLAAIFSLNCFSAREVLALCGPGPGSMLLKNTLLCLLADCPMLNATEEEVIANAINNAKARDDIVITATARQPTVHLFITFLKSPTTCLSPSDDKFFNYIRLYYLFSTEIASNLLIDAAKMCQKHPDMAQRILFLISTNLRHYRGRRDVLNVSYALLMVAELDDFSRNRVLLLLTALLKKSYSIHALVLHVLCKALPQASYLFPIISEYLSPLIHSEHANLKGQIAFASCLSFLIYPDARQSYLNLALVSIQAALQGRTRSKCLDTGLIAILLQLLVRLVKLQHVSPKLVWKEFALPLADDPDLSNEICELAGTLSQLIPPTSELEGNINYVAKAVNPIEYLTDGDRHDRVAKVDPNDHTVKVDCVVFEAIQWLKAKAELGSVAAILGLIAYPVEFLKHVQIKPVSYVFQIGSFKDGHNLTELIRRCLEQEIKLMPRSLFLGTSSAADFVASKRGGHAKASQVDELLCRKSASWTNNPVFAGVWLKCQQPKAEDAVSTLQRILSLPSLSLQHWYHRQYFCSSFKSYIGALLAAVQNEEDFVKMVDDLEQLLFSRIKAASSATTVFYALLCWSYMTVWNSKLDGSMSRLEQSFVSLLQLNSLGIPERMHFVEEVQVAQCIGIAETFNQMVPGGRSKYQSEFEDFLRKLRTTGPGAWLDITLRTLIEGQPIESIPGLIGMEQYREGLIAPDVAQALSSFAEPGPAIKKIERCYFLAGVLAAAPQNRESITTALLQQLEAPISDTRLLGWLLVILQQSSRFSPKKTATKTDINRFGPESAYGWSIESMLGQPELRGPIAEAWNHIKNHPKMDWMLILPSMRGIDDRTFNDFILNQLLVSPIVEAMQAGKLPWALLRSRLPEVINACKNQPDQLLDILRCGVATGGDFWRDLLENLPAVRTVCSNINDLVSVPSESREYWLTRATLGLKERPMDLFFTAVLQNSDLVDAVGEIGLESLDLVAAELTREGPGILYNILISMVVSLQDAPEAVELLAALFTRTLRCLIDGPIAELNNLQCCWNEYRRKNPAIASRLRRHLSNLVMLLPPDNPLSTLEP